MAARKAASVLPDPVGAAISTCRPAWKAGHACACAAVGAAKLRSNQAATAGRNKEPGVMEPELWVVAAGPNCTRAPSSATYGFSPAESIHGGGVRMPAPAAEHPGLAGVLDRPEDAQFATSVVIRLGTSPTGMTA